MKIEDIRKGETYYHKTTIYDGTKFEGLVKVKYISLADNGVKADAVAIFVNTAKWTTLGLSLQAEDIQYPASKEKNPELFL